MLFERKIRFFISLISFPLQILLLTFFFTHPPSFSFNFNYFFLSKLILCLNCYFWERRKVQGTAECLPVCFGSFHALSLRPDPTRCWASGNSLNTKGAESILQEPSILQDCALHSKFSKWWLFMFLWIDLA